MQSLYGNISGYIGFFAGISLLQLPNLFQSVYSFLRKTYPRNTNKTSNNVDLESIIPQDIGHENTAETQVEKARKNFT